MLRSLGVDPTSSRSARLLELLRVDLGELRAAQPGWEAKLRSFRDACSEPRLVERRQRLREFLSTVRSNPERAADEFQIDEGELQSKLPLLLRLNRENGSIGLVEHYDISDPDAFDLYARLLFLGLREDEHIGKSLCQCNYCHRFFLRRNEKRPGAPSLKSCPGTDHGVWADQDDSRRRKAESDKRKRAVKLLGNKRDARDLVKEVFKQHPDATPEQLASYVRKLGTTARKHK
jgi:hypothetical protein